MILFLFKKFVSGTVLARQLRKPSGLTGRAVNMFMNSVNKQMNIATVSQLMIRPDHKILDIGFVPSAT